MAIAKALDREPQRSDSKLAATVVPIPADCGNATQFPKKVGTNKMDFSGTIAIYVPFNRMKVAHNHVNAPHPPIPCHLEFQMRTTMSFFG